MASSKLLYREKMLPNNYPQRRKLVNGDSHSDFVAYQLTNDRRVIFKFFFMLDLFDIYNNSID